MEFSTRGSIIYVRGCIIILLMLVSPAAAQNPKQKNDYVRNIGLCNQLDRASLQARIDGCTALIDAGQGTTSVLAIAYNNRGNAYTAKADYDRAIQDFDESIKLNPTYAKPSAAWPTGAKPATIPNFATAALDMRKQLTFATGG